MLSTQLVSDSSSSTWLRGRRRSNCESHHWTQSAILKSLVSSPLCGWPCFCSYPQNEHRHMIWQTGTIPCPSLTPVLHGLYQFISDSLCLIRNCRAEKMVAFSSTHFTRQRTGFRLCAGAHTSCVAPKMECHQNKGNGSTAMMAVLHWRRWTPQPEAKASTNCCWIWKHTHKIPCGSLATDTM